MKKSYLYLSFILLVHNFEVCFSSAFLEPKVINNFQESFVLNDLEYIFTNQRVSWEEAEIGCSSVKSGSLAIINSKEKADFLALALAETELVLEDIWIGASAEGCLEVCDGDATSNDSLNIVCKNNTCFKWITSDYVNAKFMLPRFGEEKVAKRECLSFARNDHQLPSFVDLYCKLKRPYMCERPSEQEDGEMTHRGWIRIGGYEYAIFYAKKTWKEAVRECFSKHKAHLADFRTMEEVAGIGKYLLTGRPSLENAWIGGHYKEGKWRYISIDDVIPDKRNPETMYPPWPETNETLPQEGCLLLDRHLQDGKKLIFLQARCHRRKSYICSRRVAGGEHPLYEIIIIDGVCYTLFYSPKTWFNANRTCHERKAWLVEVTSEKVDHVLYIMGENRTEINHVWIGGKLKVNNQWYWVKSNDIIESDNNKVFNGYPPWLDTIFDQKYACLNLDRENHNKAIFYGVYCEVKQPFICQQYDDCPIIPDDLTTTVSTERPSTTTTVATTTEATTTEATTTKTTTTEATTTKTTTTEATTTKTTTTEATTTKATTTKATTTEATTTKITTTEATTTKATTTEATTTTKPGDIWKWKWPTAQRRIMILKPYFNWSDSEIQPEEMELKEHNPSIFANPT